MAAPTYVRYLRDFLLNRAARSRPTRSHSLDLRANPENRMRPMGERALSKLPEVTLGFWIIKILATTLGETGGDAVTMSMNLGYLIGTAIFGVIFAAAVTAQ